MFARAREIFTHYAGKFPAGLRQMANMKVGTVPDHRLCALHFGGQNVRHWQQRLLPDFRTSSYCAFCESACDRNLACGRLDLAPLYSADALRSNSAACWSLVDNHASAAGQRECSPSRYRWA